MSRRNTISREFFATIAAVLVLGLSVMCAIQTALSAAYFISERKSSLTDVLNGATALSERFADEGSIVTKPLQDDDIMERAHSGFELFNTASGALIFIADGDGNILLHTGDDAFTGGSVPTEYIDDLNEGRDIFETGTLGGVYCAKYYTAGRRITVGGQDGYLFAASPMAALGGYMSDMLVRHLGSGHSDFVQHPVLGAGAAHHRADRGYQRGCAAAGQRRLHGPRPGGRLRGTGRLCDYF